MDELNKLNESTMFRRYMTEEEDQRKIYNSRMKSAEKQGLEAGKKEKSIEIAKNMISKYIEIDIISEVTGLSNEEIENLK